MRMATLFIFGSLAGLLAYAAAQQEPVPVDQEPHHKVVLKNDYVEVLHVTIPAGQSTLLHTHSHPGIAVHLTKSKLRIDPAGGASKTSETTVGEVVSQPYKNSPFTHRVNNVGDAPFEVIDIEFLKRPDGAQVEPIAKPVLENESARAYSWELAPKASSAQHTHNRPYLIISVTPMDLGMQAPDGRSITHHVNAGDFHWVDSKVTHTLTNNGDQSAVIVEVELK
jgi:quercetin dioxygenase-like cupin family protein